MKNEGEGNIMNLIQVEAEDSNSKSELLHDGKEKQELVTDFIAESSSEESQSLLNEDNSIEEEKMLLNPIKSIRNNNNILIDYKILKTIPSLVAINNSITLNRKFNIAQESPNNVFYKNNIETAGECYKRILMLLASSQNLLNKYQQANPEKSTCGPPILIDKKLKLGLSLVKNTGSLNQTLDLGRGKERIKNQPSEISNSRNFIEDSSDESASTLFIPKKRKKRHHNSESACKKVSALQNVKTNEECIETYSSNTNNVDTQEEVINNSDPIYEAASQILQSKTKTFPLVNSTDNSVVIDGTSILNDLKRPLDSTGTQSGNPIKKSKTYSNCPIQTVISSDEDIFLDLRHNRNDPPTKSYSKRKNMLSKKKKDLSLSLINLEKDSDNEVSPEILPKPSSSKMPIQEVQPSGVECPICSHHFPIEKIEMHASECNFESDSNPAPEAYVLDSDDEIKHLPVSNRLRPKSKRQ